MYCSWNLLENLLVDYSSHCILLVLYREGHKSALRIEYKHLKMLELQGRLKKIDGTPSTAEEEIAFLLQFAKNRLEGKYKDIF